MFLLARLQPGDPMAGVRSPNPIVVEVIKPAIGVLSISSVRLLSLTEVEGVEECPVLPGGEEEGPESEEEAEGGEGGGDGDQAALEGAGFQQTPLLLLHPRLLWSRSVSQSQLIKSYFTSA